MKTSNMTKKEMVQKIQHLQSKVFDLEQKNLELQKQGHILSDLDKNLIASFDASGVGITVILAKGSFLYVNKAAAAMLEYTLKELEKKTFTEITHPDDIERSVNRFQLCMVDGKPYNIKKRYISKSGKIIHGIASITPIFDEDRNFKYVVAHLQDVSELKNSEEKLTKSEEKYRLLFQNMIDAYALHEIVLNESGVPVDYVFLELNPAFEKMTGLKRKKIIGRKVSEALNPVTREELDFWVQKYGEVALTGKEERFESFSEPLKKWYSVIAFRPQEGLFATVFQDITEQKETEEKLNFLTKRLQLSTESANIGIWDLDLKNNVLTWDKRMYELYGISPEEFGGAYEAWKNGVHPDDVAISDAEVQNAIKNKKDFHAEFRVVWPNKEIRYIEAHAIVSYDENGEPLRMNGVNWDITKRKIAEKKMQENEEKYRLLFELANDPILVANPDTGIIIDANKRAEELLGKIKNEIVGQHQSTIHPSKDINKYKKDFKKAVYSYGKIFPNQEVIHKDGHHIPVEISSGGKFKLGDEWLHVGIFRDISERLRTEEELNNYKENLEEMVNAKTKELEKKNKELERFNKLFVGREFRIKELKNKIAELEKKLKLKD